MTRELAPAADRLKITVCDEPGSGGPTHQHSNVYEITQLDASTNPAWDGTNQHKVLILMQNGPVPEGRAANGLTEVALLAIVIDRLRSRGMLRTITALSAALKTLDEPEDGQAHDPLA